MAVDELDVVVVGAGLIGLAVARALAMAGREVIVLEAESTAGAHTSSRNSEVIHAGIYYPTGSAKARFCVEGNRSLYAYAAAAGIAHARVGKLIVATRDQEIPVLERLKDQANANGALDLTWLDAAEVLELEPHVSCVRALWSPSTGIVDSHGLLSALRRDAVAAGAHIVFGTPVLAGRIGERGIELSLGGAEPVRVLCKAVVNAAGLRAPEVAGSIAGVPRAEVPKPFFAKGHYFTYRGRSPFSHLVYPVPAPGGLGVHVTVDLAGTARFGPDVSWIDSIDYTFDDDRAASFYTAIRNYYPALADGTLEPGYTGIRPKLAPAGAPAQDFIIHGPSDHGVPGLVNLYGIESPGLTAALPIADHVRGLLVP
jgi:L-2-hydroxyglutarate oxidase LhgO